MKKSMLLRAWQSFLSKMVKSYVWITTFKKETDNKPLTTPQEAELMLVVAFVLVCILMMAIIIVNFIAKDPALRRSFFP